MGSLLTSQIASVSYKTFSVVSSGYKRITPIFMAFWMCIVSVLTGAAAAVMNGGFRPSAATMLIAPVGGLCFVAAAVLYIRTLATGPFVWSVLIMNLSGFVPVLYSLLFLGESVSWMQTAGVLVILSILFVMSIGLRGDDRPFTPRWLALAVVMMLCNGGIVCTMKTQHYAMDGAQALEYLALMYLWTAVFSFLYHLISRDKNEKPPYRAFLPPAAGLVCAIGFGNVLSMTLMTRVPAAVQFPVSTGCGIILTTIVSMTLYRERPGWRLYLSVALLILGVTLLSR